MAVDPLENTKKALARVEGTKRKIRITEDDPLYNMKVTMVRHGLAELDTSPPEPEPVRTKEVGPPAGGWAEYRAIAENVPTPPLRTTQRQVREVKTSPISYAAAAFATRLPAFLRDSIFRIVTSIEAQRRGITPRFDEEEKSYPGFFPAFSRSLAYGVGQTLQDIGGALKWSGRERLGEAFEFMGKAAASGQKIEGISPEEQKRLGVRVYVKPQYIATDIAQSLPAQVPLMVAGATPTLAGNLLGPLGAVGGAALGAGISRAGESYLEAGQAYEAARQMGYDEETARKVAETVYKENLKLTAADIPQLALTFAPLPAPLRRLATTPLRRAATTVGTGAGKIGLDTVQEAAEEFIQQNIQEQALAQQPHSFVQDISRFVRPSTWTPEESAAALAGGFMGGLLGGAGVATDVIGGVRGRETVPLPAKAPIVEISEAPVEVAPPPAPATTLPETPTIPVEAPETPAVELVKGKTYAVEYKGKTYTGELTSVGRVNARLKISEDKSVTIPIRNANWTEIEQVIPEQTEVISTAIPKAEEIATPPGEIRPTYRLTEDRVEVQFPAKPEQEIVKRLREAGFKWSRKNKLWYADQTEERVALAKELAGEIAPIQPEEQITPTTPESEAMAKELAEGKTISPEELKDYPDLAAKTEVKPSEAVAETFEEIKRGEEEYEQESQRKKEELAKKIEESKKTGNVHLDDIEKPEKGWNVLVGHRVMDVADNRKGTIKEVDEEGNVYIVYDDELDRAPRLVANKAALVLLGEKKPNVEKPKIAQKEEEKAQLEQLPSVDATANQILDFWKPYYDRIVETRKAYAEAHPLSGINTKEIEAEVLFKEIQKEHPDYTIDDFNRDYVKVKQDKTVSYAAGEDYEGKRFGYKTPRFSTDQATIWFLPEKPLAEKSPAGAGIKGIIQYLDLEKLTYEDLAAFSPTETEGIGKYKGIKYRTAEIIALDKNGRERRYRIKASNRGKVEIKDLGVTQEQLERERQAEFEAFPEQIRRLIEENWPRLNTAQKIILAKIANGQRVPNTSASVVLGGAARHRLLELFPGIRTLEDAKKAIYDWAQQQLSGKHEEKEDIKGGEKGEAGASAPVVGGEGIREEEGVGTETGVPAGTHATAGRFNLDEKFPEEVAQRLVGVLNELDDPIREFAITYNGKGIRFNYIDEAELKRLPPHLQEQISMANAICVNHNWIGIPVGREIDATSIVHEIAHMAYYRQLDKSVQQKALELVLADGNKIINFIKKTKPEELDPNAPISQSELANRKKWHSSAVRRYKKKGYGPKEIEKVLEINLLVPDRVLGEIAKLVDCMAHDDQYATIAYHLALCKEITGETFSGIYDEEAFAYLAGARPEILARALENKEFLPEEVETISKIEEKPLTITKLENLLIEKNIHYERDNNGNLVIGKGLEWGKDKWNREVAAIGSIGVYVPRSTELAENYFELESNYNDREKLKRIGAKWGAQIGGNKSWYLPKDKLSDLFDVFENILIDKKAVDVFEGKKEKAVTQEPQTGGVSPSSKIAAFVKDALEKGESFNSDQLFKVSEEAFGGTQAQGKYTPKDAYDAMELGVNQYLLEHKKSIGPMVSADTAKRNLESIEQEILEKIPTQTKRTEEQEQYQQYSTPPNLAYVAAWAANIYPGETVLEPSAGVGGLAVFAKTAGANVIVNELSERRAELLKELNFDRLFTENAEQLNNILPEDIKPTVILMNPPFSATAGRMGDKKSTRFAKAHIEQALARLEPGGRLVAIVGQGMADNSPTFAPWWKEIKEKYNVKANIRIDGSNYRKYGTTFDVQLVIIDKTGPTTDKPITDEIVLLDDIFNLLEGIKHERRQPGRQPGESVQAKQAPDKPDRTEEIERGRGEAGPGRAVPTATDEVGTGARDRYGEGTTGERLDDRDVESGGALDVRPPGRPGGRDERTGIRGAGSGRPGTVDRSEGAGKGEALRGGILRAEPTPSGETVKGAAAESRLAIETEIAVRQKETETVAEELTETLYVSYKPQKLDIPGAKPHPGELVQSAAMSAVEPPVPVYTPNLPKEIIEKGILSDAQLEAVVYAGQNFEKFLPTGERKGFFIGDGTGVGKGREIAGIILDSFRRGQTKAVWVSKNIPLIGAARRDLESVGIDPKLVFEHTKTKFGEPIKKPNGILFTAYTTLGYNLEVTGRDFEELALKKGKKSRVDQVVEWLGEDFEGVIVFDESHHMRNCMSIKKKRGASKPATMALAAIQLARRLPKAKVVYVSATGSVEVTDLGYLERLGLWGEGTPFANKRDFVTKIASGGIAAMELVARDMKALGNYIARNLSYNGVTYDTLVHQLDDVQIQIYDTIAQAWQIILQNMGEALKITQAGGQQKAAAMSAFWGAQLRFFNQVLTAMQMPSVIKAIKEDLKNGHSVVLQIVNTNEAPQERAIAKKREAGEDLEDLDLTPRDIIIEYLKNSFPVQQYQEVIDENGNVRRVKVVDSKGNPVLNREAVAKRDELIHKLGAMRVPDNPLDMLINTFGYQNVAEITGRTRRLVKVKTEDGGTKTIVQNRTVNHRIADAKAFMDGKKRILVFSDAGGTGESYHADRAAKNQQKRIHYLIQAGWSATKAVQGFGRTHRSNQVHPPTYVLVTTNLKGQRRFISTIARRLDQLGALTKGQRQTGSQGLFSASDNLENDIARDALDIFYQNLIAEQIEGINGREIIQKIGLEDALIDKNTGKLKESNDRRDTTKFLNRILVLKSDEQNKVFDAYFNLVQYMTQKAIESGTYDKGLENFKRDKVEVKNEIVVYRDPATGAETKYIELSAGNKVIPFTFEDAKKLTALYGFYRQKRSGRIYAIETTGAMMTTEAGHVVRAFRRYGQIKEAASIVNGEDLANNYEKLDDATAEKLWNEEVAKLPEYKMDTYHLISGTILPIWDRLPTDRVRVIRVRSDDGRVFLGRIVAKNMIRTVLHRLGAEVTREQLSPADIKEQILENGRTFELANGWKLVRRRISGEYRIEILGDNLWVFEELLKKAGVFTEKIDYAVRYFIPTSEKGIEVIDKITRQSPIVLDDEATIPEVEREMGEEINEAIEEVTPKMGFSIKLVQKLPKQSETKKEWRFEDEEIQERWDAAKLQKETLLPKIKEALRVLWKKGTREFEHLPHTPEFAELRYNRHGLLSLLKQREVCGDKTLRFEQGITIDLNPYTFDLFTKKVILDDLAEEAKLGHKLPFGFTPETLAREKKRLDTEVEKYPEVKEAIKKRSRIWKAIKNDYIRAMKAIDFEVENRFTRENYYRHQVLLYARAKSLLKSTGQKVRTPVGRGFLKRRRGSEYDINTDYLIAEYEVMAQMLYDIEVAKLITLVKKQYNIRPSLERQAKEKNNAALNKIIIQELEENEESPTAEALKDFRKKLGRAFSELRELAENDELWDGDRHEYKDVVGSLSSAIGEPEEGTRLFRYLSELAKDKEKKGNIQARTIFKAITDRREFIKETLGDKYVTWEDLIPEGYTIWQPREGNVLYLTNTIPERIAEALQMGYLESIGITKDELRRVRVVGSPHKEYVVKEEVALTLDNLRPPLIDNVVLQVAKLLTRPWKIYTLTAPQKLLKYNARNISGDADAVFVGNPSAFKKVPDAIHDLYQVLVGNRAPSETLKAWLDRGGMQATLQAVEAGNIKNLEIFMKLYEKEKKQGKLLATPEKIWRRYWQFARLSTDFREAILRYASFMDYLEQMKNDPKGRPKNFGASDPKVVMELTNIEDKAYMLSNQLLGAYDQVSVIGQNVREFLIPFWSWNEVNFKRYKQFWRNAWNDRRFSEAVGRKIISVAVRSPFIIYNIGKITLKFLTFSAMLYLYNLLLFRDEEEDLPKEIQMKPHIILGRDKDGKVKYLDRLGAFADFLEWFGLDDIRMDLYDVLMGRMSFKDWAKKAVISPFNKVFQGITPLIKMPFEAILRTSIYPDISKPRHIYDSMEYIAQQFGVGDEYKALKGLPRRPYSENLKSWFALRSDPSEAAYYDVKDLKQQYLRKLGKGNEMAYFENPKSEALYNLKMAIRYKDLDAFERYLQEYILLGGTPRGLQQSLDSLHPLYGLKGWNGKIKKGETNEAIEFWLSLTPEEQDKVREAVRFYEEVLVRKGDQDFSKSFEKAVEEALKKME